MNRLAFIIAFILFPALVFAETSTLNFTPPPTDYSMYFLSSLFGIVDGVLIDTGGHQILGEMFKIFNSAVLAIGGMIIMYTLLVSTINTAHKGQMMGEKWSSVWVPVRAVLGLALLVPKASGYCLIQIIVMWVVVQGVGAADKVWNAALDYLNRGGLIVQSQINANNILKGENNALYQGASAMLTGQVCMLGIQKILQDTRNNYLHPKGDDETAPVKSICEDKDLKVFCNATVPDFVQSVDFATVQSSTMVPIRKSNEKPTMQSYEVKMPNFTSPPYDSLNGICGSIKWNGMDPADMGSLGGVLSGNQATVASQSRAIALQQMYSNLSSIATMIVNNDPYFMSTKSTQHYSEVAKNQFGVPYNLGGTPCSLTPGDKANCIAWGPEAGTTATLFSGAEFLNAIQSYTAVMMPTNRLIAEAKSKDTMTLKRQFIKKSEMSGWIMAGSYFIDLARINSSTVSETDLMDKNTGLDQSKADLTKFNDLITNGSCQGVAAPYTNLCIWLQVNSKDDTIPVQNLMNLISGTSQFKVKAPQNTTFTSTSFINGLGSSTVNGFISNSTQMSLPTQPGQNPPQFALKVNMDLQPSVPDIEEIDYSCKWWYAFCIDSIMVNVGYNLIFKFLYNAFATVILGFAKMILMTFLQMPLQMMSQIFIHAVSFIQQPSVNPVIALANMGVNYINYAMDLWITLTVLSASLFLVLPMLMMVMPLLTIWVAIMMGIGFITAYYIPFLPYMIFTFGSLAWLMAVAEAMVAAPIVALGITHPEGEGAFGKGEQAIMLLMNVFLRPAMMIIGYIAAIALSYIGVWIINSGFSNVVSFIQGDINRSDFSGGFYGVDDSGAINKVKNAVKDAQGWADKNTKGTDFFSPGEGGGFSRSGASNRNKVSAETAGQINTTLGYSGWAGIYGFFFSILIYTTMYMTVVQKSFTLIVSLPDKVLRWIAGGQAETLGSEAVQWAEEGKQQVTATSEKTAKAGAETGKKMGEEVNKKLGVQEQSEKIEKS